MTEANGTNIIMEELQEEINELKHDIAEKTNAVAETAAINYDKMKEVFEAKTEELIERVKPYVEEGKKKTCESAEQLGETIKENPLASVGIAFVAGLLLAKLFSSRD